MPEGTATCSQSVPGAAFATADFHQLPCVAPTPVRSPSLANEAGNPAKADEALAGLLPAAVYFRRLLPNSAQPDAGNAGFRGAEFGLMTFTTRYVVVMVSLIGRRTCDGFW